MKAKLIFLLIGIALGTLISAAAWVVRRPARVAFVEELAADRQQLRTELATLQTRIARLETDNARLTADNLTLKTPPAPKAVTNAKPAAPVSPLAATCRAGWRRLSRTSSVAWTSSLF
jgi:hypothetical protein